MASPTDRTNRTTRPWGWYETVSESSGSKIKRICVLPGQQISLQKHQHRAEHWVVVQGVAHATLDDRELNLGPGEHCDIALGQVHRLANRGEHELKVIEIQLGDLLNEDDIVRLQDDYGRQ
jgi:mannose-6-phosphate isomerase